MHFPSPSPHLPPAPTNTNNPLSIALNIAEGTGKKNQRDRKRFYAMARGSAIECAAISDLVTLVHSQVVPTAERANDELKSVVRILSAVCSK